MKQTVVVGRKWNNPQIEITVSLDGIEIQMSLPDFLKALALEAGNPTTLLTINQLENRLVLAAEKVTTGMKLETAKVV